MTPVDALGKYSLVQLSYSSIMLPVHDRTVAGKRDFVVREYV